MKKKYGMITKASVKAIYNFYVQGKKRNNTVCGGLMYKNTKNIFLITRTRIFYTSLVSHKYKSLVKNIHKIH